MAHAPCQGKTSAQPTPVNGIASENGDIFQKGEEFSNFRHPAKRRAVRLWAPQSLPCSLFRDHQQRQPTIWLLFPHQHERSKVHTWGLVRRNSGRHHYWGRPTLPACQKGKDFHWKLDQRFPSSHHDRNAPSGSGSHILSLKCKWTKVNKSTYIHIYIYIWLTNRQYE